MSCLKPLRGPTGQERRLHSALNCHLTSTFRNALKAAADFLNEDLKAGAGLLAEAHPLLYARLREARRIDGAGYGRGAQAQAAKTAKKAARPLPNTPGSPPPPAP